MSYDQQAAAVQAMFDAAWVNPIGGGPLTPVAANNVPLQPAPEGLWADLNCFPGAESQASVGPVNAPSKSVFRNVLLVAVRIFAPATSADTAIWAYAEAAAVIFRGQQVVMSGGDYLYLRDVEIKNAGQQPDGWYMISITARGYSDSFR